MTARLVLWLIRWRWLALLLAVVLVAAAYPVSRELSFDRSIENMFAADDPLLPPYRRLKQLFAGNEVVLVAYADPLLMTPEGYGRVAALTDKLAAVDGVTSTISMSRTPLGAAIVDDQPASRKMIGLLEGYAVGPDTGHGRTTAAVVCMLDSTQHDAARQDTINAIRSEVRGHELPAVMVGEPVMVTDGFRFVNDDGRTLGYTSLVLLSATILVCFRSLRWMLIPLAVIQLTLVLTWATLVLSRLQLSMVSSMLTAIVTVIAVATVIHVIVRFRDARARGASPRRAMFVAARRLAVPIALACMTDAVGFGALLWARVGPVQDFGVMMSVGSLLVIAAVALLVPALALAGRFDVDPHRAWGERSLDAGLNRLIETILARPRAIGLIAAVVGLLVAAGGFNLRVETNFTKNFRATSEIARSYQFVESNLGGAGVLDVVAKVPDDLDAAFVERLRELGRRLRTEVGGSRPADAGGEKLTKVLSLADVLDATRPGELLAVVPVEQMAAAISVDEVLAEVTVRELMDIVPPKMFLAAIKLPAPLKAMAKFLPANTVIRNMPEATLEPLVKQISPETFLRIVPPAKLDEIWGKLSVALKLRVMRRMVPEMIDALVTADNGNVRIMLRAREQASADEKQAIIEKTGAIAGGEFAEAGGAVDVTGFYVLLTSLVESMVRDQWVCFCWAVAGIGLMMLAAFRSLRLALIALVPNVVPIMMVMGGMGWLGLRINMGAAMIAAVSMGLSIDSSIHYLSAFRRARRRGKPVREALHEVHHSVGRALVFATLALIVGFTALCGSQFVPTVYFGALVSLSMLGGLLGNLVVLPVLLILTKA